MLILASQSPQRREILERLGMEFEVIPSNVDEAAFVEEDPIMRAKLLAQKKAADVAERIGQLAHLRSDGLPAVAQPYLYDKHHKGQSYGGQPSLREGWVIGVDTLVVSEDGELLEKPVDESDARRMLILHSGHTSTVHSGICLMKNEEVHTDVSTAHVTFENLSDDVMDWWIETKLWQDRSGGFQIDLPNAVQHKEKFGGASSFESHPLIQNLDGEFETVVGFPIAVFQKLCSMHKINFCYET